MNTDDTPIELSKDAIQLLIDITTLSRKWRQSMSTPLNLVAGEGVAIALFVQASLRHPEWAQALSAQLDLGTPDDVLAEIISNFPVEAIS